VDCFGCCKDGWLNMLANLLITFYSYFMLSTDDEVLWMLEASW
jgi:hypothetical protein